MKIPAGSRLIAHYAYDNSRQNPANPDPSRTIRLGPAVLGECSSAPAPTAWTDETSSHLVKYDQELQDGRLLGSLDQHGRQDRSQPENVLGKDAAPRWDQLDTNHDGVLDKDEIAAAAS